MRILAVIPARAGSKGVPNKNIRIINGKPLISYCIENALQSQFITDIVVTSDSPEIKLIANYYGVIYKQRCPELCEDAVTLDAVIFDACKDIECDYVITMQPTSPTLRYNTLDSAIQYAVKRKLDTLISVVNKPHLAWIERENQIIPDYKERLNRQYLPKRYLETGAFVISKKDIVTSQTRIGSKVDVYEISEQEAIDIDSFQDLICAEQILQEHHMAIIVNGNNQMGLGHICRMLELADLFYYKPDIYYSEAFTVREAFGNTTYSLIPYKDNHDLILRLEKGNYQIIINDILDTTKDYIKQIKELSSTPQVVNFEDLGTGGNVADIVINALYDESQMKHNVYFGEKYYLAPKLFLLYKPIEIRSVVSKIFVCFGGADPQGYTEKLLEVISGGEYLNIEFTIVLGRAKLDYQTLMQRYEQQHIHFLYDVRNMPELMSKCDVAMTSRGRTCYELAMLGIPTIAMAQNEREEKHCFACAENGFWYLGKSIEREQIHQALNRIIQSEKCERKEMQDRMLAHDLKKGRERIRNLIDSLL